MLTLTPPQLTPIVTLVCWVIVRVWRMVSPASFEKLAPEVQALLSTAIGLGIGTAFPAIGPTLGLVAGSYAKLVHDTLRDSRARYKGATVAPPPVQP